MSEYDTRRTNEIVCPYCGYRFSESWKYDGDDGGIIECPECDKQMELSVDFIVTYHANKPDWLKQWRRWNAYRVSARLRSEELVKRNAMLPVTTTFMYDERG